MYTRSQRRMIKSPVLFDSHGWRTVTMEAAKRQLSAQLPVSYRACGL